MAASIGRCGSRCAPTITAQSCRRSPRSARTAPHGAVPPRHCPSDISLRRFSPSATSVWSSPESVYGSCQCTPLHQATLSDFTNGYLASDDTAQHNTVPSSNRSAQHAIIGRVPMATHGTVGVWLDRVKNEYKFQQYCRDLHTITQHACASASRYESVGARILGVESDWGFLAF